LPTSPASPNQATESGKRNTEAVFWQQHFEYDPEGNRREVLDLDGTETNYKANVTNQYIAVLAIESGQQKTENIYPAYDPNGNMLADTKNTYAWDADIHLLSVVKKSKVPNSKSETTRFAYDSMNRRVARLEPNGVITLFVHNGWNVVSEFVCSSDISFTKIPSLRLIWGHDISNTGHGAGGIGGLLKTSSNKEPRTVNFFSYDSNGNVVMLTNNDGKESARYKYDAFGKLLTLSGPAADGNRYRFSTKPVETPSNLVFFGFRYYFPEIGRWASRDPSGERSGTNLFAFCHNNPTNLFDPDGLRESDGFSSDGCEAVCDIAQIVCQASCWFNFPLHKGGV